MKANLILTKRGTVTLPARLRAALGLQVGDKLIGEFDAAEAAPHNVLRTKKKPRRG